MKWHVNGCNGYAYTGGKPFNASQPTVVFIHGVLNDHSVWTLQTRYFAHHGFSVLALDLPGHGKSAGEAPQSVAAAASFIVALLDAAGVTSAALVGHSWGSLIALEVAANAPHRVSHLALVGTAFPMAVSPGLLDMARHAPLKAIDVISQLSHAKLLAPPSATSPRTSLYGAARALMRRVLASNSAVNLLERGFDACNHYGGGLDAMARVQCPVLFLIGQKDRMTPPKAAQALVSKASNAQVVATEAGHQMMLEAPDAVLQALKALLAR